MSRPNKNKRNKRNSLWVDSKAQGLVLRRVIFYYLICSAFVTLPLLIAATFNNPNRYFFQHLPAVVAEYWPVYLTLVSLLPFVLIDALRVSNSLAGPIYRVNRQLDRVIAGEQTFPIKFRKDDQWQELAEKMNKVVDMINADDADNGAIQEEDATSEQVAEVCHS